MASGLNIGLLRKQLEQRFGIALDSGVEEFEGGAFSVIRPLDLQVGNGFSIVVARTHRQLEASFKADNFSAALLRTMAEAEDSARNTFAELLKSARAENMQVYLAVNGGALDVLPSGSEPWRKLEIDVSSRVVASSPTAQHLADQALVVCSACLGMVMSLLPIESKVESLNQDMVGAPEGAMMTVQVNRYERSPANRAACIAHFGARCQACGFDFHDVYGELGEGFIEVHHRVPVSKMGANYFVRPTEDLVPVCSNCHSMLHRECPPMAVEALAQLIASLRADSD